jgi:hypothetical protein
MRKFLSETNRAERTSSRNSILKTASKRVVSAQDQPVKSVRRRPKTAERRFLKIDAPTRQRIENAIERMIEALDALEAPTEDLEDDGPEAQVDDDPIDDDEFEGSGTEDDTPTSLTAIDALQNEQARRHTRRDLESLIRRTGRGWPKE